MNYPVKIQNIKITAPTKMVTGLSSYDEIVSKKTILFNKQSDAELINTYARIHGEKLNTSPIASLPKEEKRKACVNALTFQLELVQEVDRNSTGSQTIGTINPLSIFLTGRSNTSSSTGLKYFWQVATFQNIQDNGFNINTDLSEHFANQNIFVYLLRTHSFKAITNAEGLITESPKRNTRGGNILTLNGNLIFQQVSFVIRESADINADVEQLQEVEKQNALDFTYNGVIDASEIPTEIKMGALFNDEFQSWLQEEYASRNLQMMTAIA